MQFKVDHHEHLSFTSTQVTIESTLFILRQICQTVTFLFLKTSTY